MDKDSLNNPDQRNIYRMRLIELVRANPILWDKKSMDFTQRAVKTQKWLEVSEKLEVSIDKIRRTWENLRDQYRRDLKRSILTGTPSQWRFFEDMDFIRSMVRIKGSEHRGKSESESEYEDVLMGESNRTRKSLTPASKIPTSTAKSPDFVPIQLNTEWKQLTDIYQLQQLTPMSRLYCNQQQQPLQHSPKRSQPLRNCDYQQFDNSNRLQYCGSDTSQLQNSDHSRIQTPNSGRHQLQDDDRLHLQACDSSEDREFSDIDLLDISNVVKIEIDSDSTDRLPLDGNVTQSTTKQYQQPRPEDTRDVPSLLTAFKPNNKTVSDQCVSTSGAAVSRRKRRFSGAAASASNDFVTKNFRYQGQDAGASAADLHDEDYHFVMSILPTLRHVESHRKFPLRSQIMSLISKELEEATEQ